MQVDDPAQGRRVKSVLRSLQMSGRVHAHDGSVALARHGHGMMVDGRTDAACLMAMPCSPCTCMSHVHVRRAPACSPVPRA